MKAFLYAAGFSLVLTGVAVAQPAMPPAMPPHDGPDHGPMHMQRHAPPNPDLNGDGKVTLDEFLKSHIDRLMSLDTNKDGKVTEAEFNTRPMMMGHDAPPPPPPPEGAGKPGMMPGHGMDHDMMGKMRAEHQAVMFDMLDVNDDGVVSKAEVERVVTKRFKRLDKNNDGVLSGDELPRPGMMDGHPGEHGPK